MKQWKTVAGATVLALAISVGSPMAQAAGGDKGTGKGAGKGAGKGQKGQRGGMMQQQFKRIEDVLGKPLTDEQKTAITDSFKTYQESVAKTLGMTLDEWTAKQKEYREAHKPGAKPAEKPAEPPAPKPAQP